MRDFKGKTVVITGASSGIGLACAQFFSQKGARVFDLSRKGKDGGGYNGSGGDSDSENNDNGRNDCGNGKGGGGGSENNGNGKDGGGDGGGYNGSGGNIKHLYCDVTNGQSIKDAAALLGEITQEIHLLINNAGYGISGAIEDTPTQKAKEQFEVNFFGTVAVTNALLPLIKNAKGKIICMSSVAAALPIPFQAFYSASKAAINSYAFALANELRPFKVGVCALMPGDTKTSFTQNRQKQRSSNQYELRTEKSVAQMEKDEAQGGSPQLIAKKTYKLALKKHLKPLYTAGFKYNFFVFLTRLLPGSAVNKILGLMYSK